MHAKLKPRYALSGGLCGVVWRNIGKLKRHPNGGVMNRTIDLEEKCRARNSHPLPVGLTQGEGAFEQTRDVIAQMVDVRMES